MTITRAVPRVDARGKIRGESMYIQDYFPENVLHAATLRGTIGKGKVTGIEYPSGYDDISVIDHRDVKVNEVLMIERDMPVFASDTINYYGEPIAIAVGEDRTRLASFLRETVVSYEKEEGIYSIDDAEKAGSIFKHHNYKKGKGENVKYTDVFEKTYRTGYQDQAYMETQGVIAEYKDGKLTLLGSMQCPFYVKKALVNSTGLDEDDVIVIQSTTGGAFGGKEDYPSLMACQAAAAAMKLGRPVSLIFGRREDLLVTTKKHPSKVTIKTYLDGEKIVSMKIDVGLDGGYYIGLTDVVLQRSILTLPGSYNFENLDITGVAYKTSNAFCGAFRGFGAPQSLFALEMHMNQLARKFGKDPIEYRNQYFLKQFDTSGPGGIIHENVMLTEMRDKLVKDSGYESMKQDKKPLVGLGVSFIPHGGGFTGDGEASHIKAKVWLHKKPDGKVYILVSSVEMGQGTQTSLSKIVSRAAGIPLSDVVFDNPDTSKVPDSGPTAASRTVMVVGTLLYRAAIKVKERYAEPDFVIEENFVQPDYVKWDQETLSGNAYMAYSWSAILARVEVDPLTYEATCTDIHAIYDIGVPMDENLVKGQMIGGIVQGIGGMFTETMESEEGKILHDSFGAYTIPTTLDIPKMTVGWVDNYFEDGPFGAKPVGELTVVGVYPALASAVQDALDRDIDSIPLTPEAIREVMKK